MCFIHKLHVFSYLYPISQSEENAKQWSTHILWILVGAYIVYDIFSFFSVTGLITLNNFCSTVSVSIIWSVACCTARKVDSLHVTCPWIKKLKVLILGLCPGTRCELGNYNLKIFWNLPFLTLKTTWNSTKFHQLTLNL